MLGNSSMLSMGRRGYIENGQGVPKVRLKLFIASTFRVVFPSCRKG